MEAAPGALTGSTAKQCSKLTPYFKLGVNVIQALYVVNKFDTVCVHTQKRLCGYFHD